MRNMCSIPKFVTVTMAVPKLEQAVSDGGVELDAQLKQGRSESLASLWMKLCNARAQS